MIKIKKLIVKWMFITHALYFLAHKAITKWFLVPRYCYAVRANQLLNGEATIGLKPARLV